MQLIRGLSRWPDSKPCVVTIGNFDGVHLGHQAMLKQLVDLATRHTLPACVISFEPLPQEYFSADKAPARLHGFRDRIQTLSASGVDRLLLLNFDEAQASQSADAFVNDVLVNTLHVQHLLVGDDFRFGKGRSGDFALLQTHAEQSNFDVERYDTINISGSRVSSTRIREYLAAGELSKAAELLGHPYHISGRVIHGEKVGRQLGFPTANIALHKHRPPLRGVFAVIAHDRTTGQSFAAVANLGERPTVGGRRLLLEVHALDSDVDLYGHHMQIEFIEFVRAEQKFDSLDALKQAISNDSDTASRILNGNPQFTNLSNRIH